MKMKKKTAMIISFALGSVLFASTALAEINSKSGYEQMKDALKYTAEGCSSKLSNYTVDMSMIMKDNGNIISSDNNIVKYDVTKGSRESKSTSINQGKTTANYNYFDKKCSIYQGNIYNGDEQNDYYVNEYENENQNMSGNFRNPFKEKGASDIEKIADALIGNLKDYVVVSENTDGTKQLSGSLSEAQIPAIANALVSYQLKTQFRNSYNNGNQQIDGSVPKIEDDIYVKEVKGNMTLDKDGLVQTAMGTGLLSGKDKDGKEHKITFELLIKISDVNKTIVNKPDLSGKKVQTNVQRDYDKISKPEMYLGTYKNDIVIEKDGKFQKIGEKTIEITSLDDKNVSGTFHEEYIKGNEKYSSKAKEFKFNAKFEHQTNANFDFTDSLGKRIQGGLWINPTSSQINFNYNGEENQGMNNGQYNRVFN